MMGYKMVQNNLIPSKSVHALLNLKMIINCLFYRNFTFSSIQTVPMFTIIFFLTATCHLCETSVRTWGKDSCLK